MIFVFDGPMVVFWLIVVFEIVIFVGVGVLICHVCVMRTFLKIVRHHELLEQLANERLFQSIYDFLRGKR